MDAADNAPLPCPTATPMIEPPEVPHHHAHHDGPPKQGWAAWIDRVMPLSVLLLSVGSLYVALHTGSAMDKLVAHNEKLVKAQSTPILQYSNSNYDLGLKAHQLSFKLENVGTGPARLTWVRVSDSRGVYDDFSQWLRQLAPPDDLEAIRRAEVITGNLDNTVLPAREERTALVWGRPEADTGPQRTLWEAANQARGELRVEACYCSVFDECWQGVLGYGLPRSVPSCGTPPGLPQAASAP